MLLRKVEIAQKVLIFNFLRAILRWETEKDTTVPGNI